MVSSSQKRSEGEIRKVLCDGGLAEGTGAGTYIEEFRGKKGKTECLQL